MFYQKILNENKPFTVRTGKLNTFLEHRHADVEIYYILSGEANVIIDKKKRALKSGDIAVVLPMMNKAKNTGSSNVTDQANIDTAIGSLRVSVGS